MDIDAFQPSGFPDKTGFCSYCYTFAVGFCNLLLYICVFVSNHGLIFLNLLYGEPLFPLFFLFSAVITHQFLFNKIYDRKKSLQCKRFRPILNSSGTCAGWDRWGHNYINFKTLKLMHYAHIRSVSLSLLWSWVLSSCYRLEDAVAHRSMVIIELFCSQDT